MEGKHWLQLYCTMYVPSISLSGKAKNFSITQQTFTLDVNNDSPVSVYAINEFDLDQPNQGIEYGHFPFRNINSEEIIIF